MSSKRLSELVAVWVSVNDSFVVFVSALAGTVTDWDRCQSDVVKVRLVGFGVTFVPACPPIVTVTSAAGGWLRCTL